MDRKTYFDQEMRCQYVFDQYAPFHHLFTPGGLTGDIFVDRTVKEYGLNLLAICAQKTEDFRIIAYSEMTDHLHVLYSGSTLSGNIFFNNYFRRFRRICGRAVDLSGFTPTIIPLPDLRAVRNEIVYINRNGYVVNPDCTPLSYPWGSGVLYFNPLFYKIPIRPYSELTRAEKRAICRSRDLDLPPGFAIMGNLIAPYEYCHAKRIGEKLFRNAHQYFNLLSKNYEAYSEISKRIGESIFIPDEEMISVARHLCLNNYNVSNPALLKVEERIELAKRLHSDYNASNKQLYRILKLEKKVLNELFPSPLEK